jgi:hypothetical protein
MAVKALPENFLSQDNALLCGEGRCWLAAVMAR